MSGLMHVLQFMICFVVIFLRATLPSQIAERPTSHAYSRLQPKNRRQNPRIIKMCIWRNFLAEVEYFLALSISPVAKRPIRIMERLHQIDGIHHYRHRTLNSFVVNPGNRPGSPSTFTGSCHAETTYIPCNVHKGSL